MGMREEHKAYIALAMLGMLALMGCVLGLRHITGFNVTEGIWWKWLFDYFMAEGRPPLEEVAVVAGAVMVFLFAAAAVPWSTAPTTHGKAAWARPFDLRPLKGRFGLEWARYPKPGVVLGLWRGRYLTMAKPLSVMLFGPTRGGKTAGCVLPTALNLPNRSIIVNDPSGDIHQQSAGYRARLGPVYRLQWDAGDGDTFNPLDGKVLPPDAPGRGDLVDILSAALLPSDGQVFFKNAGMDALSAATLFLIYKAEHEGRNTNYAEVVWWFSTLVETAATGKGPDDDPEWLSNLVQALRYKARAMCLRRDAEDAFVVEEVQKAERARKEEAEGGADPQRAALERYAGEAREFGFPSRIADGLLALAAFDYRTRSNIIGTVNAALRVFRNEFVVRATSSCTVDMDHLRGRPPAKKRRFSGGRSPVSVYLVVNPAAQEAYGPVTALFLETAYFLLSRRLPKRGELGVTYLVDEMNFLPKLDCVKNGPAILAKYDVNLIIGFQARGQVREKYGEDTLSTWDSNTPAKVILNVFEQGTAEWVSKMIGDETVKRESKGRSQGEDKFVGTASTNVQWEGRPLVRDQDIKGLDFGRQLVLFQYRPHRPVMAKSALVHKDRVFKHRAKLNPRPAV